VIGVDTPFRSGKSNYLWTLISFSEQKRMDVDVSMTKRLLASIHKIFENLLSVYSLAVEKREVVDTWYIDGEKGLFLIHAISVGKR